ncbi:diacylglycerol/lipid kinase family protein [Psychroflexus montanilacus]|uniref:diacylglycerol/lipid kinase family protein n=1 Tax=Psychroflexus montanilacus TaxID=2873598 RepID=UPI001CCF9BC1|nr:diacylglycerol kinase family protein [Psychroflexus montanilacus]MBZ9651285.1 lipid kinase [Psychroflexus montanilacus]
MDILLVINPVSGGKNKNDFIDFAKKMMIKSNLDYHIYKTSGKDDCKEFDEIISSYSPKKVIIVGGDGTLNMFLQPLMEYKIKVGFIPMGSANGMAVELNLTNSPRILFEKFLKSDRTTNLDLLSINDNFLLLHLGDIGANANLVYNYEKDGSRGMLTYAKHFWTEFQNPKSFEFEIETEQMEYQRKGVMLAICNGRRFGTGIPLNSIGKMNDGFFEFVLVRAMDFSDLIGAALSKFDEDYTTENLETIQAKSAKVKFKQPRLLQIDGEVIEEFTEINIKVLPNSLTFIQ